MADDAGAPETRATRARMGRGGARAGRGGDPTPAGCDGCAHPRAVQNDFLHRPDVTEEDLWLYTDSTPTQQFARFSASLVKSTQRSSSSRAMAPDAAVRRARAD